MSWSPPNRYRPNDLTLHPWSEQMAPFGVGTTAAPASGTWSPGANTAILAPIYLVEPFVVAKAWWANGATVGTDSIDIGVYQMTDQSAGRVDLIRSTGYVLSAGSASVVQETATWRVAKANLTASSDSTDATSYTTASVTLVTGRLYLLSVENSHGTSATAVSSITGGPTFTSRSTTQYNSSLNRVSIWSAVPTSDYTGTLTIDFGATTQTGCVWSLNEFSGVDTASNDGIVQQAVGTGSSGTALSTLAAFGSANNATFAAHGHAAATASAPGSGFTELSDTTAATPAQALCTDWRVDNDTTADATFTSAQWGSCAVEIKADTATPFVIPPSMSGNPSVYMGFEISGTTATILRGFANSFNLAYGTAWLRLTTFTSGGLPSSAIATNSGTQTRPLAGFSSRSLIG